MVSIWLGLVVAIGIATPPYGDPNQPYDQLPGTLETPHVKWARPLAGGPIKALFILPYGDAREVVEIAQRLQLDYSVIMNAGHTAWADGYGEGDTTTPLVGVEAKQVLERIVEQRLSLSRQYDVIVIGKVSWVVIPPSVRSRILEHVARGSGLVSLSPHRLKPGYQNRTAVADSPDVNFSQLFETGQDGGLTESIRQSTPFDVLPIQVLQSPLQFKPIAGVPSHEYAQAALCLSTSRHGGGRIVAIDYFDEETARRHSNSLTPYWNHPSGDYDAVGYDFSFAILTRCMLWAADRQPTVKWTVSLSGQTTEAAVTVDPEVKRRSWHDQVAKKVVARSAPVKVRVEISAGMEQVNWIEQTVRTRSGKRVSRIKRPVARLVVSAVDALPRGDYLVDIRLLGKAGAAVDFASTSFRVESDQRVENMALDRMWYKLGQQISGTVRLTRTLRAQEMLSVVAVDTWDRVVAAVPVVSDGAGGTFTLPVQSPLSEIWDIVCRVTDERGVVDERSVAAPIPNRVFDDYMFMLIFSPTPGRGHWKGDLYGRLMREYGINSTYTYLIYNQQQQFSHNARSHLRSIAYAEHHGELLSAEDRDRDPHQEQPDLDLAELSRMLRRVAETGEKIDPQEFPYRMRYLGAEFINARIDQYRLAARFGSPFYTLTGENYLSGEFRGRENSGFGATTTRVFQDWCREQYGNDLTALNAEWNTHFKSWQDVRGILLTDAVKQDQLPRWVDFRYFMRSRVWSQYFIDWTRMMRRFIPAVRTGRVGHDHHDFSRYRSEMTSSKLYIGQEIHPQWRHAMTVELPQSFASKPGFLMAPQSVLRWNYDHQSQVNRERYPWLVLMLGLNGFDWENCLTNSTLGGLSCFTPDFSEPLPFFEDYSREVRALQRGLGKWTIAAQPHRSDVAILWSSYNHYISRCLPFEENGFSGTWLSNISVTGGAPADALALLNSIRLRPTIVAPEDLPAGGLAKRGCRALVLPYNKGMSQSEADAIRQFVEQGGVVIGTNHPGSYTEHGRKLPRGRLADLFPVTDQDHFQAIGKGCSIYLVDAINGYIERLEKDDHAGSDRVADLLRKYAGQRPPVEVCDRTGKPRRDIFTRVFRRGSTRLVGLLGSDTEANQKPTPTILRIPEKRYIYDVRGKEFLGYTDQVSFDMDLRPRMYALLAARVDAMGFDGPAVTTNSGTKLTMSGRVRLGGVGPRDTVSQALHVRVYDSTGEELEWFRQNLLFSGEHFEVHLPLALSIKPGRYRLVAEHAFTGLKATTMFQVLDE